MKDFRRDNQLFALCGLNCSLCPMHLGKYCPGCGGGEGNQSCAIAKCSLQHEKTEYCCLCRDYPCKRYQREDELDSFITHRNKRKDFEKFMAVGESAYNLEQMEKAEILNYLLENYNDGRRKNFFCLAVNLLEPDDLHTVMNQIAEAGIGDNLTLKEKAACVVKLFQQMAEARNITLKLRKKR